MLRFIAAAALAFGAAADPAPAATISVTSPLDNGSPGTLREAIAKANASVGVADTIKFALPASASPMITPISNLPAITDPVVIDGGAKPSITLDARFVNRALALTTDGSVVRGLHIMESTGAGTADGILVQGDGNRIEGSYIGTDLSGVTRQQWNLSAGIAITGDGNVVADSVIAEIYGNGVSVTGDENRIEGSHIGLDLSPGTQLGNRRYGLKLDGDGNVARENEIGDNNLDGVRVQGDGNVVEGNNVRDNVDDGIAVRGDENVIGPDNAISSNDNGVGLDDRSDGNRILGNAIGGANRTGVHLDDSSRNTVEDNVITDNDADGVLIDGTDRAEQNVISGNTIGAPGLGNRGSGVFIDWSPDNFVGPGNTISSNLNDGVTVVGSIGGDTIQGNAISGNDDLGIDLDDDGITLNDASPDADGWANDRQNHPEITAIRLTFDDFLAHSHVSWALDSAPATTYRIELFNLCGTQLLASFDATTDINGHAAGTRITDVAAGVGATATAPDGSTSELAPCI